MSVFSRLYHQSFFLPQPTLTGKNLPDQHDRVTIITGGYAGVGFELARIIYQRNGIVYIAFRSQIKAETAISTIKAASPASKGRLEFLQLDLSDLSTINASAEAFVTREQLLDVLVNNAGVMAPPLDSKSAQGYELQMATNCLGPFLFTKLLLPSPPGGVSIDACGGTTVTPHDKDKQANYGASKTGNVFLASELARRYGDSVQSNAFNPGNLRTELQRNMGGATRWVVERVLLYPPVYGGYTELFAGWAEEAGRREMNGGYVIPWGRFGDVRADVQAEIGKEGGKAERFWDWCERETEGYL
ncbi:hypothetical protein LTR85_011494 [Meristemomyces frigidus]|nr:hypothetical protein LTR85_011494 [Meristemomyces frigidus]